MASRTLSGIALTPVLVLHLHSIYDALTEQLHCNTCSEIWQWTSDE